MRISRPEISPRISLTLRFHPVIRIFKPAPNGSSTTPSVLLVQMEGTRLGISAGGHVPLPRPDDFDRDGVGGVLEHPAAGEQADPGIARGDPSISGRHTLGGR